MATFLEREGPDVTMRILILPKQCAFVNKTDYYTICSPSHGRDIACMGPVQYRLETPGYMCLEKTS